MTRSRSGFIDAGLAGQLREAYEEDRKFAKELTFEIWQKRSAGHRLLDRLTFLARKEL